MATNKEYLQNAYNNIQANKQSAIVTRTNEIMTNEVNPAITEKRKKFDEAWAAARTELEKENQALKDDGAARAKAEVEEEYKQYDILKNLIGE